MTEETFTPIERPQPKTRRRWLIPVAVGVVALLVGTGIGAAVTGDATADDTDAVSSTGMTVGQLDARQAALDKQATDQADVQDSLKDAFAELDERDAAVAGAEKKAAEDTIPGDGTYLVGTDVKPGRYRSVDNVGCYWERNDDAGGEGNIIANDNVEGQGIIELAKTDALFVSSGCSDWTLVK